MIIAASAVGINRIVSGTARIVHIKRDDLWDLGGQKVGFWRMQSRAL